MTNNQNVMENVVVVDAISVCRLLNIYYTDGNDHPNYKDHTCISRPNASMLLGTREKVMIIIMNSWS